MDFKDVRKQLGSTFIVIIAISLISATVYAGDWPNWRGPNYDGISTEADFNAEFGEEGPKLLWQKDVGIGFSAVSEANGKAYLMGNKDDKDTVYCVDAVTGEEIWTQTYDQLLDPLYFEGGPLSSPTIVDGKVYTQGKDGITLCIDEKTGNIIWRVDVAKEYGFERPTWGFSGSVVVIDDLLIMNVGRRGLAIKKSDGSFVWGSDKTPGGYATPLPFTKDGKKCVAIFGFKEIVGYEAATGKQIWEYTWETEHEVNAADPIIDGDKIFISSGYGTGCAMLQVKGNTVTKLWQNRDMKNKMSGSVLIDGAIYGPDEKDGIVCMDAATGNVLWSEKYKMGAITAAGDKLIVLGQKGKLATVKVDKTAYKPISVAQVLEVKGRGHCWTTPTLSNGRLYLRDSVNHVKCFDVSASGNASAKTSSDAYWPQWQGSDRSALSPDTGLLKKWPEGGPEMLWKVEGIGKGFSSIVTADGMIYINGMIEEEGIITALDMDGNVKWAKPYAPEWSKSFPGTRASVTIDNGKLYILSGTGVAACLDAKTGDKIWSADVMERFDGKHHIWGYGESLLVVDDKVICTAGGEGASIVALSTKDGSTVWQTEELSEKASYSSPIVIDRAGKKVIIQVPWHHLVAVDAANGDVLAKYDTKDFKPADQRRGSGTNTNSPVYLDGYIYLTSGYDSGSALLKLSEDATSITKVWENHDLDVHHGGVVVVDGNIYGANWLGNPKGNWCCVDFKTGKTNYETEWQGNKGSIGYADGMLYCYDEEEGTVALVKADPEKFDIQSTFTITMGEEEHWAHPVIIGGRLYIRHGDVLMVYNVKS